CGKDVGRGTRAPRRQAGEPDGARRRAEGDRRVLRPGPPFAVAAGGRPRQHDARPRPAQRRRARLRPRAPLLLRGRDRRGVRRGARRRQPDPAPQQPQAGRTRPPRRVPADGARARAGLDPALERTTRAAHDRGAVRGLPRAGPGRQQLERVRMRWRRRIGRVAAIAIVVPTLASCSARAGDATEANCPIEDGELFVLMAQSVPSATLIPCIEALPAGWMYGGSDVNDALARFWLDSDRGGLHAVEVSLTASCRITGAVDVTNSTSEGGGRVSLEADEAVTFGLRTVLVRQVQEELGLTLCGAGAPPCVSGD